MLILRRLWEEDYYRRHFFAIFLGLLLITSIIISSCFLLLRPIPALNQRSFISRVEEKWQQALLWANQGDWAALNEALDHGPPYTPAYILDAEAQIIFSHWPTAMETNYQVGGVGLVDGQIGFIRSQRLENDHLLTLMAIQPSPVSLVDPLPEGQSILALLLVQLALSSFGACWLTDRQARKVEEIAASLACLCQGELGSLNGLPAGIGKQLLAVQNQIDKIQRRENFFRQLAQEDPLTGLGNRRHFRNVLRNEFSRSKRYRLPLSLIFIDVDDFKDLNDTYGHTTGDGVLRLLGRRIKENIRQQDTAIRFGGDEFAIILTHTGKEEARMVGEKLHRIISQGTFPGPQGERISITVSVGITSLLPNDDSIYELIRRADRALYLAKKVPVTPIQGC
ncbi:MAG: GGDEF domain-containing protein [Limnochordia bacterium]|jgi:diguanylate cyclase (GGDEF)-like protein